GTPALLSTTCFRLSRNDGTGPVRSFVPVGTCFIFAPQSRDKSLCLFSVPVPYQRSAAFTPLQRWTSSERLRIHEPRASADVEAASRPRSFGKALRRLIGRAKSLLSAENRDSPPRLLQPIGV